MNYNNTYIRFDWAIKRLLRDKANFSVLEGLLTVFLTTRPRLSKYWKTKVTGNGMTTSSTAWISKQKTAKEKS